jgi:aryl-alcohol dehydrogenase-like predicted oxidoreductase
MFVMIRNKIGETNLKVAPINLGGNVFGWTINEGESFNILDGFVEAGYNFIDTADVYSAWKTGNVGGESETIIGNWLQKRKNRKDIVIATKVGWDFGDGRKGLKPDYIKKAIEDSLTRLKTDYIDLYYTHIDDETRPVEETLEVYDGLIKEGKILHIAASNISPKRLIASLEASKKLNLPKYQALQPHYNLVERKGYEEKYASIVDEYNLSVFSYWSLAEGFLTGKYRSEADVNKSIRGKNALKYLNGKGLKVLDALDNVAEKIGVTPSAVSLAWILAQPHVVAPVVSATNQSQLENLFSVAKINLNEADLVLLNEASSY